MIFRAELILKRSAPYTFAAGSSAERIAALNHKIGDYTVKDYAVIVAVFGVGREVFNRFGRGVREKNNLDIAHCRFYCRKNIAFLGISSLLAHFLFLRIFVELRLIELGKPAFARFTIYF